MSIEDCRGNLDPIDPNEVAIRQADTAFRLNIGAIAKLVQAIASEEVVIDMVSTSTVPEVANFNTAPSIAAIDQHREQVKKYLSDAIDSARLGVEVRARLVTSTETQEPEQSS